MATTWDTTADTSVFSYSNGGLTVASGSGNTNPALTTGTAYRSTGKQYYEVKYTYNSGSPSHALIGIDYNRGVEVMELSGGGTINKTSIFTVNGSDPGYTLNDVIAFAVDFDAGKLWVAKNNTWLSSGNPATAANPFATFTANYPLRPSFRIDTYGEGATLSPGPVTIYTPPSGFSPWDLPSPFVISDWPLPVRARHPMIDLKTVLASLNLPALFSPPVVTTFDWPNPKGPRPGVSLKTFVQGIAPLPLTPTIYAPVVPMIRKVKASLSQIRLAAGALSQIRTGKPRLEK